MKIKGDYAVIETAEEAACLCVVKNSDPEWLSIPANGWEAPRELVLEAITPKEGDAVFVYSNRWMVDSWPGYALMGNDKTASTAVYVKANALTIGKTVGELRELLEWCKPTEDE